MITINVEKEKLQHKIDTFKVENTQNIHEDIKCKNLKDTNVLKCASQKVSGDKQKHEQASYDKSPPVLEEALKCNFCEIVCSQADSLREHTIKEHTNGCDKCFITYI